MQLSTPIRYKSCILSFSQKYLSLFLVHRADLVQPPFYPHSPTSLPSFPFTYRNFILQLLHPLSANKTDAITKHRHISIGSPLRLGHYHSRQQHPVPAKIIGSSNLNRSINMDDNEGRTSGRSFEESKENCKKRTKKKVNVEILIQLDIGRRSPLSCNKAMRGWKMLKKVDGVNKEIL